MPNREQASGPGEATRSARLVRSGSDQMLSGVAGGVAEYLDLDVTVVRVGFVALSLLGGAGIALYAAGWLLMPKEDEETSVAEDLLGSLHWR